MYSTILEITNTIEVLTTCLINAVDKLRKHIAGYYHNANEEMITHMFFSLYRYYLERASGQNEIEEKFFEDLKNAIPPQLSINESQIRDKISGLTAEIVLHNKSVEGKSGGDFGLILTVPKLETNTTQQSTEITVSPNNRAGLLCQAKLRNKEGKWGDFSDCQKDVLPNRMDYSCLPLYSYSDYEEQRSLLQDIKWLMCKGYSFEQVEKKLKIGLPVETLSSGHILSDLYHNKIGTTDEKIIREIIALSDGKYFEIKLHWPNDPVKQDGFTINIESDSTNTQQTLSCII